MSSRDPDTHVGGRAGVSMESHGESTNEEKLNAVVGL
jgi:hypothetical protein